MLIVSDISPCLISNILYLKYKQQIMKELNRNIVFCILEIIYVITIYHYRGIIAANKVL